MNDLTGRRFDRLAVTVREGSYVSPKGSSAVQWRCECDCGRTTLVRGCSLLSGNTTSCGCRRKDPLPSDARRTRRSVVGYIAAHQRVYRDNGKASSHGCVDCDQPAREWSYDHLDPKALVGTVGTVEGLLYSLDPAHYQPRCKSCHTKFDLLSAS